ncbi:hypothetical protein [Elioraea tepidiphila]|jgi:tetratricopeptide (TPR) repeat protein|uniref:hypothetical protein n=1 Tax=Elioraea tepidiphila TaxID=457934 RepID=UPI002FD8F622
MNLCVLGRAHCFLHEHDEAIELLEQSIVLNPSFAQGYFALGFTLTCCGRAEEAPPIGAELMRRAPGYTLATTRSDFFFCGDVALIERCVEGLRRAGVPEGPPAARRGERAREAA